MKDRTSASPGPRVSGRSVLVVIPCLNEARHIEGLTLQLLEDAETIDAEIVIADGGSTDGTREIAQRLSQAHPRITFLENKRKIQSAALNQAVELHGRDDAFLIRVDAHCIYPAHYCQTLLQEQAKAGADSVVVSMIAEGETCFQRAVAAAQNTRLGNGGSAHRLVTSGRYADHGHHALMRVSAYRTVGGYDESFSHNEDAELDLRLGSAGFKIWLAGAAPIIYLPRRTPKSLLRQYFNYGMGRAKTLFKHGKRPKLRQSLPLGVAPAVVLAALAPLNPIFALPALAWAGLCLAYGAALGFRAKSFCAAMSGVAAIIMHFGWSAGFIWAASRLWLRRRNTKQSAALPVQGEFLAGQGRDGHPG